MLMDANVLPSQRHCFEVPREIAYFNNASLAPQLRSVRAAGEAALARNARPWTIPGSDWVTGPDELRALFARLVGAPADAVALIPATSYGQAIAAHNSSVAPGDRIVLVSGDFPSSLYTWSALARRTGAEIVMVECHKDGWTDAVCQAIDERVKVVAVPTIHWIDGSALDVERIGAAARAAGATFIVDASQSLGVVPFEVDRVRPDYLVTVGYKWLLGPFAVAYLYAGERARGGEPIEHNWINRADAQDDSLAAAAQDAYLPGARRFDVGQRTNFTLVPMAAAGLAQILEWQPARIGAALAAITDRIAARAGELGFTVTPGPRGPHIVSLQTGGRANHALAAALAAENIFVAARGTVVRIAPHLYVDEEDVERLLAALERMGHER